MEAITLLMIWLINIFYLIGLEPSVDTATIVVLNLIEAIIVSSLSYL